MRHAADLLDDILRRVRPPKGCAIELTERVAAKPGDSNWIAIMGIAPMPPTGAFSNLIAELRRSEPTIDWSAVTERDGAMRRIAKYFSEVERRKRAER